MQNKEIKSTDARTFAQIWTVLNKDQRRDLRSELSHATGCSTNAIYFWAKGTYSPNSKLDKEKVAQVVSRFIGCRVIPATLFPTK